MFVGHVMGSLDSIKPLNTLLFSSHLFWHLFFS